MPRYRLRPGRRASVELAGGVSLFDRDGLREGVAPSSAYADALVVEGVLEVIDAAAQPLATAERDVLYRRRDSGVFEVVDAGGSWTPVEVERGVEKQRAEITNGVGPLANAANAVVDIIGLSITFEQGSRPIELELWLPQIFHSVAGTAISVRIYEGASIIALAPHTLSTANKGIPGSARVRLMPTAGSHTYKASLQIDTAGNYSITAGTVAKAYLAATEV